MSENETKPRALEERLTYATLRPAARLALRGEVSLRDIKKFVELAYYQEAKIGGLKMKEISKRFSISMAKVGSLSQNLKSYFVEPERQHGVGRQLLSLLWAGPLSAKRIANALPAFEEDEIKKGIEKLVEEDRILVHGGRTIRYELRSVTQRLDTNPWMAKIGGLNTLLEFVGLAVENRFFENDDRTMVRNLAFRVRDEDFDKLKTFYENELFPLIVELDGAVDEDSPSLPIKLSLLWAVDKEKETKDE